MAIFETLVNLFTNLFKTIGNFARISTCTGFFNEPEVPEELRESK